VVLTRAEYDSLVAAAAPYDEDEDDAAIFDERMAELAAGHDARLPPQVTSAMLRGDSLLKALRNWKGITQMQLSFKTNLSQNYISDLEAGRRKGTKETLALIAEHLDVNKSWLIG
jgi:DNA-binding XRE family transcriptional regulator